MKIDELKNWKKQQNWELCSNTERHKLHRISLEVKISVGVDIKEVIMLSENQFRFEVWNHVGNPELLKTPKCYIG